MMDYPFKTTDIRKYLMNQLWQPLNEENKQSFQGVCEFEDGTKPLIKYFEVRTDDRKLRKYEIPPSQFIPFIVSRSEYVGKENLPILIGYELHDQWYQRPSRSWTEVMVIVWFLTTMVTVPVPQQILRELGFE